jgi:hypothetical protein
MTEIEQLPRFIRIITKMPPEVQQALLVVIEWKEAQRK